jgi:hypothetical protein
MMMARVQRGAGEGQWRMSFVLPAKYNEDAPLPVDSGVSIRRVPAKKVAVAVFSGFVTDDEVKRREQALRRALLKDPVVRVKPAAQPEVAQVLFYPSTGSKQNDISLALLNFVASWFRSSSVVALRIWLRSGVWWLLWWQYNPPFTLPFMRRNEVSLEIEDVLSS